MGSVGPGELEQSSVRSPRAHLDREATRSLAAAIDETAIQSPRFLPDED